MPSHRLCLLGWTPGLLLAGTGRAAAPDFDRDVTHLHHGSEESLTDARVPGSSGFPAGRSGGARNAKQGGAGRGYRSLPQ
jgi:hypothetical protein